MPEARFSATGHWAAPAGRRPAAPARRAATRDFQFELDIADSGALLRAAGHAPTRCAAARAGSTGQVAWLGSPLALDFAEPGRPRQRRHRAGQFLQADPGAARLLGVLSLQSLPRRLTLDFRDVFQEGFAFDSVTGDVAIAQRRGEHQQPAMRGVQAAVLMEGSADIARETQDLRVVVVPEINAGAASLAYAVINPVIGLGTFLAQLFLREPLAEAGTREFRVTGPWADPQVDAVAREPAPGRAARRRAAAAASGASPQRHLSRQRETRMKIAAVQMVSTPDVGRNLDAARAADRAGRGRRRASWWRCPSTSACWAAATATSSRIAERPATARSSSCSSSAAREHGVWLVGGTLPMRIEATRRTCATPAASSRPTARSPRATTRSTCSASTTAASATTKSRVLRGRQRAGGVRHSTAPAAWRVGLSICYDLRFPELYRALMHAAPCDLLAVPSAFTHTTGQAHWELLLRARAVENQAYVIAPAQGGLHENGRRTWGHSMIVDPWGEVLACLPEGEGVVTAELDAVTHRRGAPAAAGARAPAALTRAWREPEARRCRLRSAQFDREAVEQAGAAGALQRVHAAAARLVRRVPRLRRHALVQASAVAVADHRRAGGAAGPVAAGRVDVAGDAAAVGLRAGQDVVHVRRVAAAVERSSPFSVSAVCLVELVVGVQVVDAGGDHVALDVLPRARCRCGRAR